MMYIYIYVYFRSLVLLLMTVTVLITYQLVMVPLLASLVEDTKYLYVLTILYYDVKGKTRT